MVTTFAAERGTWPSLQITCFWQFCPIFIQLFYTVFTWILVPLLKDTQVLTPLVVVGKIKSTSNVTTTTTTTSGASYSASVTAAATKTSIDMKAINRQRRQARTAQSKDAVEKLYLTMLIVNLCIYYVSFVQMQLAGVQIKDSIISLASKTPPTTGLGDLEINQFFSAHILMLDLMVVTLTCALWSLYEDGVLVFLVVTIGVILIGPGSCIAGYALYREERTQDPRYLKNDGKKTI